MTAARSHDHAAAVNLKKLKTFEKTIAQSYHFFVKSKRIVK